MFPNNYTIALARISIGLILRVVDTHENPKICRIGEIGRILPKRIDPEDFHV
jgi:hypothetical protein